MTLPMFEIHIKTNKLAARNVQFTNARPQKLHVLPQISRTKNQVIITTSEFSYYQFLL